MKTVAVIFGGRSTEHDISVVTAISSIIKPLEMTNQYKVEAVYITKDGQWYWDEKLKDISLYSSGEIESFLAKQSPVNVQFGKTLQLNKGKGLAGRKAVAVDVVFPAMHGTYGEDGALMGLLDMAGVPYVGCSLASSVVAMDKVLAKQVAAANNISVTPYVHFSKTEFNDNPEKVVKEAAKKLQFPVFVKPAHLGSSIGISRVEVVKDLHNAIEVAVHFDDKVLIEEEVKNLIEVTLPVMGNDTLTPALLERPLTSSEDFFDFDTKYIRGGGKKGAKVDGGVKGAQGYSELPAKLPKDLYATAEATGLEVYRALNCSGTARVDLLIDSKQEKIFFNEVNPLPGSLYAHNWRASGVPSIKLVQNLVELALERHAQRTKTETAFSTNFLKQF